MNHWQPEFGGTGPRGRLEFSGNLSGLRGGPQSPNFYNQYASFLLGLTSEAQKAIQWEEMSTREWRFGFYFGDRWQAHRDITLDLGVRYEYFPLVTRARAAVSNGSTSTRCRCCSAASAMSRATWA